MGKLREYKFIFVSLICISMVVFGYFVFLNHDFLVNADQQLQYHIFYEEWINLLIGFFKGQGFPFYSWTSFLGTDFYSSAAYYVVGDIFLPMILFFYALFGTDGITIALFIETILCLFISAITMRIYLKEFGIKNDIPLNFIPLVYAISGWATLFLGQYMFHRFYAFLPLVFFGIERFLNKKKSAVFIISVALLFLQSYYLMFPTTIFIFIYGLFATSNRRMNFKEVLMIAVSLILRYLTGFFISAIVIFPALLYVLGNPRIGTNEFSLFWELQTYLGFVLNFIISPFPVYTDYANIFYAGTNGHEYWYSLFVGIIPIVTIFDMFRYKKYKNYIIVLGVLLFILLLKLPSSFMHGLSEPSLRWTFLLIFFLLLSSAKRIDDQILDNEKKETNSFVLYLLLCGLVMFIGIITGIISAEFKEHIYNIIISFVLCFIIYFTYIKNSKLGFCLLVAQLSVFSGHLLYTYNSNYYKYDESINKEYVSYFQSIDEDLVYRYYIDNSNLLPSSPMNLNKSIQFGYMGVSSYNTLYDTSILKFLNENEIYWHIIDLDNPKIMKMLGVKYFIVYDESELPIDYSFEYAYNLNHLQVYEFLEYEGFGYSANEVKYLDDMDDLVETENTIFIDNNDFDISKYANVTKSSFVPYLKGQNYLNGTIVSDGNNILQIPIPDNKGWKVIRNGEEIESVSVNGGFLGIEILDGSNDIQLYFSTPGFKAGAISTFIGIFVLIGICIKEWKNEREKI